MNETITFLKVIRAYLPVLIGIAVAAVNLYVTHSAHGPDAHTRASDGATAQMEVQRR